MMRGLAGTVVALLVSVAVCEAGGKSTTTVSVFRDDGWTVRYDAAPAPAATLILEGLPHVLLGAEYHPEIPADGWPGLPVVSFCLGIPSGAGIDVALVDPRYEISENVLVAPVPTYESVGDTDVVALYIKNRQAYSYGGFLPGEEIGVSSIATIRGQRIATVRMAPYRYNPATRTLRRLTGGRLEVRLSAGRRKPAAGTYPVVGAEDPLYEQIFHGMLLNYQEARDWRLPPPVVSSAVQDSTRDWFEPGRQYIVIPTSSDGWHRVEASDLLAAGYPGAGVDPATMKLYLRGREVPIVVRPDGAVEFYGLRNRGDSSYIDFYTDTTAFWLTWGGTPGLRFSAVPEPAGAPARTVHTASETQHLEQNKGYYFGTTLREVSDNAQIPGEGWVWEYFYPNSSYEFPFVLDSLDGAGPASVRVRLYSTTLRYNDPDHVARFWMNDSLLGDLPFRGRDEGWFDAVLPPGLLRSGANRLRITSIPTLSTPNQFYLDWFDVESRRFLLVREGQLMFDAEPGAPGELVSFVVDGFLSPGIEVYDLSGGRQVLVSAVDGDSLAGYRLTFQDTLSVSRRYLVRSPEGRLSAGHLRPAVFSDLRSPSSGADYLVVTHSMFRTAATELAAHRSATNGVRATVVDIQDIYDQFNYGILHVDAIKRFLRHAYDYWPRPAPASLVFVGDASEDSKRYLPSSTKTEFIPAYGHPAGDNWYACFDSVNTFLSSLMIGRLPFEDTIQAARTVEKIKRFDSYVTGDWNKKYLFITGGNSESEQAAFGALSEALINDHVLPAPLGGVPLRVYKTTSQVIDGESKQSIQEMVKDGLLFMNFLGHSGGRIWNVDIGSPNDLENISGRLPFVTSVSCNVANFASGYESTLSEDFLMADNRGAIAVWGSSSLGYANTGTALVRHMFEGLADDSLRTLGSLTTAARYRLWQTTGSGYLTVAHINLTPLVGDPLSRIAVPLAPDLAVEQENIITSSAAPAETDSTVGVSVRVKNYGLVSPDSVRVTVDDSFQGSSSRILSAALAPLRWQDSVAAAWNLGGKAGAHTLVATVDPDARIQDHDRSNNSASVDKYVYVNNLTILLPFADAIVPPGPRRLVVAADGHQMLPAGALFQFELDTVRTFDSPFRIVSGGLPPGPAATQWTTPSLAGDRVYFWRARMEQGGISGKWASGSFGVAADSTAPGAFRWHQFVKGQFAASLGAGTMPTDSGVTITAGEPLSLYVRSLGYRGDVTRDYFSQISLNGDNFLGYWWVLGSSFMALRVHELTGRYDFRGFNIAAVPAQADSMAHFIETAADGTYIVLAVILDGSANMTERLRTAIESLGSTQISQLGGGHAWSLIARKPPGAAPVTLRESLSPTGITEDSLTAPSLYSRGSGDYRVELPRASEWKSFRWQAQTISGRTDARLHVLADRGTGTLDTLRSFPADSSTFGTSFLTVASLDSLATRLLVSAELITLDAATTPLLRELKAELVPVGDIAVSNTAVAAQPAGALLEYEFGSALRVPFEVHNFEYRDLDSARIVVDAAGTGGKVRLGSLVIHGPFPPGTAGGGEFLVPTEGLPLTVSLTVTVERLDGVKDLFTGNNSFEVTATTENAGGFVQLASGGVVLVDGDYLPTSASVSVRTPASTLPGMISSVRLFVDDAQVPPAGGVARVSGREWRESEREVSRAGVIPGEDPVFDLTLGGGSHELKAVVVRQSILGIPDTLARRVYVTVTDEQRIERLYNYPNPFSGSTEITFVLSGSSAPETATIRIFSIAGRRIRRIELLPGSVQVGFNRIPWDGRDDDGDDVANGVYFLQLEVRSGDRTTTALEKMARVR